MTTVYESGHLTELLGRSDPPGDNLALASHPWMGPAALILKRPRKIAQDPFISDLIVSRREKQQEKQNFSLIFSWEMMLPCFSSVRYVDVTEFHKSWFAFICYATLLNRLSCLGPSCELVTQIDKNQISELGISLRIGIRWHNAKHFIGLGLAISPSASSWMELIMDLSIKQKLNFRLGFLCATFHCRFFRLLPCERGTPK